MRWMLVLTMVFLEVWLTKESDIMRLDPIRKYTRRTGHCVGNSLKHVLGKTQYECAHECDQMEGCVAFSYLEGLHECELKSRSCNDPETSSPRTVYMYDRLIKGTQCPSDLTKWYGYRCQFRCRCDNDVECDPISGRCPEGKCLQERTSNNRTLPGCWKFENPKKKKTIWRVCSHSRFRMTCSNGQRIETSRVDFGRFHLFTSMVCGLCLFCTPNCQNPLRSLLAVRRKCDDRKTCEGVVTVDWFGYDPCPQAAFKYMEKLEYYCLCPPFRFGHDCHRQCHCSNNHDCSKTEGRCPQGCAEGFQGLSCQECLINYAGPFCSTKCPEGCEQPHDAHSICAEDGLCLYGCRDGYYGDKCQALETHIERTTRSSTFSTTGETTRKKTTSVQPMKTPVFTVDIASTTSVSYLVLPALRRQPHYIDVNPPAISWDYFEEDNECCLGQGPVTGYQIFYRIPSPGKPWVITHVSSHLNRVIIVEPKCGEIYKAYIRVVHYTGRVGQASPKLIFRLSCGPLKTMPATTIHKTELPTIIYTLPPWWTMTKVPFTQSSTIGTRINTLPTASTPGSISTTRAPDPSGDRDRFQENKEPTKETSYQGLIIAGLVFLVVIMALITITTVCVCYCKKKRHPRPVITNQVRPNGFVIDYGNQTTRVQRLSDGGVHLQVSNGEARYQPVLANNINEKRQQQYAVQQNTDREYYELNPNAMPSSGAATPGYAKPNTRRIIPSKITNDYVANNLNIEDPKSNEDEGEDVYDTVFPRDDDNCTGTEDVKDPKAIGSVSKYVELLEKSGVDMTDPNNWDAPKKPMYKDK